MSATFMMNLRRELQFDEGKKLFPYKDVFGNLSIGVGRNLSGRGITDSECDYLFQNDVDYFISELKILYPWFKNLNEARQIGLISLSFMGLKHLSEFTEMLSALSKNDWEKAKIELLDSLYAKELPERAQRIGVIFTSGNLPPGI